MTVADRFWGLCVLTLAMACTSSAPAPRSEESSARPESETPTKLPKEQPEADDERWQCSADGDCTQTCALGAVAADWLKKHPDADTCDDGCGWKQDVACRDGSCVTLTAEGEIDPGCTRRKKPMY